MADCKHGHTRGRFPSGSCRECHRLYMAAYNVKNRDSLNKKRRQHWRDGGEEVRAKARIESQRWRDQNREAYRAAGRRKAARNPESYSRWQKANPEECRAVKRAWKKRNPHRGLEYDARRRAIKYKAFPKWADRKAMAAIYKNCPSGYHVDHIVPLVSDAVCGLHVEFNLQYLTASENFSKGNRFAP